MADLVEQLLARPGLYVGVQTRPGDTSDEPPGVARIEDLNGKPIAIGAASNTTFWPWLKQRYGFSDDQKRPYGFSVQPFLADRTLSQQGFATRSTLDKRRDVLLRFLRASAEGWKSYLANPAPGNALIRKANPQMTDALIAYGVRKMKENAIVDAGDASRDVQFAIVAAAEGAKAGVAINQELQKLAGLALKRSA